MVSPASGRAVQVSVDEADIETLRATNPQAGSNEPNSPKTLRYYVDDSMTKPSFTTTKLLAMKIQMAMTVLAVVMMYVSTYVYACMHVCMYVCMYVRVVRTHDVYLHLTHGMCRYLPSFSPESKPNSRLLRRQGIAQGAATPNCSGEAEQGRQLEGSSPELQSPKFG